QWSQGGTGGGFQGAAYSAAQPEFEGDVEGQAAFDALPAAHVLCGGLLPERCEAFPFGQGGRQEAVPLGGVLTCAVDHGTHEGDQVGGGVADVVAHHRPQGQGVGAGGDETGPVGSVLHG